MTDFQKIYDRFLGKITDDMYLEVSKEETMADCYNILMDAIPNFEFPRFRLYEYTTEGFDDDLTSEEINILALLMMNTWLQRQITSIENTRMKYSGSDFKMTSQPNHLAKLISLKNEAERLDRHYQRLYKRRKIDKDGKISSNWSILIEDRVIKDDY